MMRDMRAEQAIHDTISKLEEARRLTRDGIAWNVSDQGGSVPTDLETAQAYLMQALWRLRKTGVTGV